MKIIIAALFFVAVHAEAKIIFVGKQKIDVEIAQTKGEQEKGLMFREKLEAEKGMLFIFADERVAHFWMKNTLIPLSIGFFDNNKKLFQIIDMEPASPMDNSPPVFDSKKPARYALEVNKGWFKKKKISLGAKLGL